MSDDEHRDDEGDEAAEAERRRQEQIAEENRRKKEAQARMKAAQAKKKSGKRKGLCLTPEKKKLLKNGQIQEVSSDSDSDDDTEPVMTSSQCFSSADALSEPSLDSVEFPSDRDDCEDQSHDVISIASDSGISSNNSTLTREEALKLPDLRRLEEDLIQQNVEIKTPEALEAPSRKLSFELPAKRRGIFVPSDRRVLERWSSQEKPTSPDKKEPAVDKWTAVNCAVRKQHASSLWLPNDADMKDEHRLSLEGSQSTCRLSGESKSLHVPKNTEPISPRSQKNYGRPNRGSWLIDDDQSLETDEPPKIDAKAISSITKEILAISRVSSIDFTDGETRELKKSTNVADKTDTTDKVKALTAKFGRSSSILDTDNHPTNEMDPVLCARSQKSKSIASAFESKISAKDDHIYLSDRPKRTSLVLSRFQPQASTSNYSSSTLGRPKSFTSNLSGSRSFSRSLGDLSSPGLSSVDISIDTPPKNIKSMREKFESKDSDSDDPVTLRRPRTTSNERAQTMVELKPPTTSEERAQTMVEFKPQTAAEKRRTYQGDIDILRKSSGSAKSLAERFQTPTAAPRQTETKPVSAIVKREPSTVRSDLPTVKRDNKLSMTISMLKATDSINRQPKSSVVMETRGLKLGTRGLAAKFEQLEANVKAQPTLSSPGRRKSYGNPSEFFKPTTKVFHVFDDSELSKKSTAAPLDYPKDSAPVSTLSTKYATLDRNSKLSKSVEMTPREAQSLKEAAKVTKLSSKFDQNNSSSDSDSDKYSKASVKSIDSNNSPTVKLNVAPRMAQLSPRESSFTKRSFDTTDSAPETVIKFSVNNNEPESVSSSPLVTNDSKTCSKNSMEDSKLGVSTADQAGPKNSKEDSRLGFSTADQAGSKNSKEVSRLGVSTADQAGSKNSKEDSRLGVSTVDQAGSKNSKEDSRLGVSITNEAMIVKSSKNDDKISVIKGEDDLAVSVKKSEISSEWRFLLDGDDDFDVTDSPASLSDKTRISRGQSSKADVVRDVSAIDSVMVDTNYDLDWWEIKPKFDEKSVEHVEEQIVVEKPVVSEKAIVKLEAPAVKVEIPELKTAETFVEPEEIQELPKQETETESDIELKPEIHDETRSEIETSEYSETETSEMDSQSEYSEKASEYSELESEVGLASGLDEPSTSGQERDPLDIEYEELAKLDRASLLRKVQELHKLMSGKEEEKYDLELRIRKQDLEINEITSKVNDVKGKYNKPVLKKVTKTEKLSKVEKKGITDVRASLKSTGQSKYQLDDQKDAGEPTTPDWRGGLGSKGKEGEEVNGDVGGGGEEVEAEA